ncbi:unnamed protein product [Arabis nemorensis]|uniref:Uncharacterized protein n=1 Tax=Arabis nemorensis TaxID=586526 RepID=A0A565BDR5_9BRAS|nr:unnamed protein product [Arabis nemorensis]
MMESSQARPSPPPKPPDPPDLTHAPSCSLSLFIFHHRLAQSASSLDLNYTGSRWGSRCSNVDGGFSSHHLS